MEKYKTIYLDVSNYSKSKYNPIIIGDDLARGIEATVNDMDAMGYELDRFIDPTNVGQTLMQGMVLLFKRIETPSKP